MPDRIPNGPTFAGVDPRELPDAINELFLAHPTAQPAAADVPGARYLDQYGTEWRSNGTTWLAVGGKLPHVELSGTGVSIPNNTPTDVTAWNEDEDTWGMHAPGSHLVTVPYNGVWLAYVAALFASNATGRRAVTLNGSAVGLGLAADPSGPTAVLVSSGPIRRTAGQTFALNVTQTSGGALSLMTSSRMYVQMLSS